MSDAINIKIVEDIIKTPLIPKPNPVERPWGVVAKNGKRIGEYWEISDEADFPNKFGLGPKEVDLSIRDLEEALPEKFFGKAHLKKYGPRLDVLVKILTAETNLSVQLHPVGKGEKTEAWNILSARPGAGIFYGLKEGVTKDAFVNTARKGGDITSFMQFFPLSGGETVLIKAGDLHAMGGGLELIEPQQPGGVTLRIYDYNREPKRELHIDEALKFLDFKKTGVDPFLKPIIICTGEKGAARYEELVKIPQFVFHRVFFGSSGDVFSGNTSEGPQGFTVTAGKVSVLGKDGKHLATIQARCSFIMPAALGEYRLIANQPKTVLFQTTR